MIDVKHLTKSYGTRFNQTKVLDNLSFAVDQGEFVGVMGPSGAGKTTLMNLLSSIMRPSLARSISMAKTLPECRKKPSVIFVVSRSVLSFKTLIF